MNEFKVIMPKEKYSLLEFNYENLPGVAVVNSSLKGFEPKQIFPWHLSIKIDIKDLIENGMPSKSESVMLDQYGDFLDKKIKGFHIDKPNALFLVRVTWNKTRELIWRINDAETVNTVLEKIISTNNPQYEFEYNIEEDEGWDLTTWYMKNL